MASNSESRQSDSAQRALEVALQTGDVDGLRRARMALANQEIERLRAALREIKSVAAIEAPPVCEEVPAKVWKIAHEALRHA